jgi:hypothetical protein
MLPGPTLPASLAALLGALRPCFTAPSFAAFCGLAARPGAQQPHNCETRARPVIYSRTSS